MTELSVVYREISELIPYSNNARTHSPEQVDQIAASILEFGWTNPILTDGANGVIAGHGRLMAASQLGMSTVPCISLAGLSDAQKRAYIIADNQLALNAGWDMGLLAIEIGALQVEGFDLGLTALSQIELANLFDDGVRGAPESSAKEINPDNYKMGSTCPKCGFEFDDKQT